MRYNVIDKADISYLDFIKNGPFPYEKIKDVPQEHLSQFCVKNAMYGIITKELIDFLIIEIGDRRAIEIGSGGNGLGRALNIPMTDNRMQEWEHVKATYNLMRQTPIVYPNDVEELDAFKAIDKHKPQVVIASWVTSKIDKFGRPLNMYGINEHEFFSKIKKFILIGNLNTHRDKKIMDVEHQEYSFDWLASRSLTTKDNRIWIWDL